MAGMYFTGDNGLRLARRPARSSSSRVAMIGSLTVLPADALEARRPRRQGPHPVPRQAPAAPQRVARVVGDPRPRAAPPAGRPSSLAAGVLVALAIPALGMHTASSGVDAIPKDTPVIKTFNRSDAAFPGEKASPNGRRQGQGRHRARGRRRRSRSSRPAPRTPRPRSTRPTSSISKDKTRRPGRRSRSPARAPTPRRTTRSPTSATTSCPRRSARSAASRPSSAATPPRSKDYNDMVKANAPIVFAFVLGLAFLLLLVTFRSLVIPIKAIVLNLLSVGAAYGVLVAGLPGRPRREAARLREHRRGRAVAAAVPVRDPVRPVDGLPRVHPQPGPRGVRSRHEHGGRRRRTASARPPARSRARRS